MKQIEKQITRKVCVKPAIYEEKATGKSRIVQEILADGTMVESTIPVIEKTFSPAVYEDRAETRGFFVVQNGDDIHEFATPEEARDFQKGIK